jgi:hypothetical protein
MDLIGWIIFAHPASPFFTSPFPIFSASLKELAVINITTKTFLNFEF